MQKEMHMKWVLGSVTPRVQGLGFMVIDILAGFTCDCGVLCLRLQIHTTVNLEG